MKELHYKIEGTIRRNKNRFIIFGILWLFMTIVIVMPISYGIHIGNESRHISIWKIHRSIYRCIFTIRSSNWRSSHILFRIYQLTLEIHISLSDYLCL
ncbi:MAG: hypothetical protein HFJ51_06105 [Clostridia bacterium]|nr:hypothetical protein [Clostridia bacterium]